MTYTKYGTTVNSVKDEYAYLNFKDAGTYWVVFTIDKDMENYTTNVPLSNENEYKSIQAVILPMLSADRGGSTLWSEQVMSFNNTDNKFHFNQEVSISDAGYEGKFKVGVYHRTTADEGLKEYGTEGEAGGEDVSVLFPYACNYEMEFTFDPIWRTAPTVKAKGYQEFTIGATGYATYSFNLALDVPSDLSAYYITGLSGQQFLTSSTTQIPKTTTSGETGTGVIIKGSAGPHRLYISDDQSAVILPGNKLSGTGNESYHVNANESYCFTVKDGQVGFYNAIAGNYDPYKAFLKTSDVSTGGEVREFLGINFGGSETTGIEYLRNGLPANGQYYNLQGQPVSKPQKGVYILNGKKVLKR